MSSHRRGVSYVATSGYQLQDEKVSTSRRRTTVKLVDVSQSPAQPRGNPGKKARVEESISEAEPCPDGTRISDTPIPDDEPLFLESLLVPYDGRTSEGKTTHDYMVEWDREKRALYLQCLLEMEAKGPPICHGCGNSTELWRCLDCLGFPKQCRECICQTHRRNPFHRIEFWNDTYWHPSWLWQCGVIICSGHGGDSCPGYQCSQGDLENRFLEDNDLTNATLPPSADGATYGARPLAQTFGAGKLMTVVHTTGVHSIAVFPCLCPNSQSEDIQLMQLGLYPSSASDTSTVFSFSSLKHFDLTKVEAHMSTENYMDILQRMSNYIFPKQVQDRRRELGRVWQQWSYLISLKRNGFGSRQEGEDVKPGLSELALWCGVCPQPGVNLPDNWRECGPRWLYYRSLVGDGNFEMNHVELQGSSEPFWLASGSSFMTEHARYQKHLASCLEHSEPATCHEHRAIADKNKHRKGYDSTGLVAIACARHGCFVPGSVVDMQKGKRQMNMDYVLNMALEMTVASSLPKTHFAYDVNCQYCVRFRQRIAQGRYLTLSEDLPITFMVGLFHVHGHKEECFARFASTLVPGAGVNSREILESLRSVLNGAAGITRTMTITHRAEMLDACINDINWKKLLSMVPFLIRQKKRALNDYASAEAYLTRVESSLSKDQIALWSEQMRVAEEGREADPKSMDIYNSKLKSVPPKREIQVRLMQEEREGALHLGLANWVGTSIELQESQIELRSLALLHAKAPSIKRSLDLERKRAEFLRHLNISHDTLGALFPDIRLDDQNGRSVVDRDACICEGACQCAEEHAPPLIGQHYTDAENAIVSLPSSFPTVPAALGPALQVEVKLRIAQANEALEALRSDIGHKSFLYRSNRTLATGKRERTRAYDTINEIEKSMRYHIKRYELATWALRKLQTSNSYPEFQRITPSDTKAVTAIWDPNAQGQSRESLSWIWTANTTLNPTDDNYRSELYRVNWIRAKARRDRWAEESAIVEAEMGWLVNFANSREHRASSWSDHGEGRSAYAHRQADMWRRFGAHARDQFATIH